MTIFQDKAVAIDGTFTKHPITDDVKVKTNVKAIMQHMDLLLMQDEDSLIGRPGTCAGLKQFLFENDSIAVKHQIEMRIKNALENEPRIKTTKVISSFEDHDLMIEVYFIFVDTGIEDVYKSTLRRVL